MKSVITTAVLMAEDYTLCGVLQRFLFPWKNPFCDEFKSKEIGLQLDYQVCWFCDV